MKIAIIAALLSLTAIAGLPTAHGAGNPTSAPVKSEVITKIAGILSDFKARQISAVQAIDALDQLGEPAEAAVFEVLSNEGFGNPDAMQHVLNAWKNQKRVISDSFRPEAMKLVPRIVKAHRIESVQLLTLFGTRPELEPYFLELSLDDSAFTAKAAFDQVQLLDPNATDRLRFYKEHLKADNKRNWLAVFYALSWLGDPGVPVLLETTHSENWNDRLAAMVALQHFPDSGLRQNLNSNFIPKQPMNNQVIARAKQLLCDPLEKLKFQGRARQTADLQIFDQAMTLLDTYGRAGRAQIIDLLYGPDTPATPATPQAAADRQLFRSRAILNLATWLPEIRSLQQPRLRTEPQWAAAQALAVAANEDAPDECFALHYSGGQLITGLPESDVPFPEGTFKFEKIFEVACSQLNDGDHIVGFNALAVIEGRHLSAEQIRALSKALVIASSDVQQTVLRTLPDSVLTSPDADALVNSLLRHRSSEFMILNHFRNSSEGRKCLANCLAADPPLQPDVANQVVYVVSGRTVGSFNSWIKSSPLVQQELSLSRRETDPCDEQPEGHHARGRRWHRDALIQ